MSRPTALLAIALCAGAVVGCSRPASRGHGPASGQWPGPNGWSANGSPPGAPPTGPAAAPPAGDPQRILDAHNRARAEHCAPPLAWSPAIAATAQRWADGLAQRGCALEHSAGPLGENLAAGSAGMMTPEAAVAMWMDERGGYDFARGGFSMTTGHFTQVVWQSTRSLGCASAACGGGKRVWVCNYDPPGNMEGDFPRNVAPPGCRH